MNSLAYSRNDATPIGTIEILATTAGIFSVNLLGHISSFKKANVLPGEESELTRAAMQQILEYFDGKRKVFDLPVDLKGLKPFQQEILKLTAQIPFGEWMTYGQIACDLGKPAASRAVGGALGSNPVPLIIPCHRVVAANGRLTGFSAAEGVRTKQWLLELEGHHIVGEKLA